MYDILQCALNIGTETFSNLTTSPYIPWDMNYLYDSVAKFRSDIGLAMGIGIFAFLGMTAVYVVINIIRSLFK